MQCPPGPRPPTSHSVYVKGSAETRQACDTCQGCQHSGHHHPKQAREPQTHGPHIQLGQRVPRTPCPIPVAGLTCVDGTRVVVGVGTPLLAAAHGGSRLLAAGALLYTHPGIRSREGEMWRDRETLSKPSREGENHDSPSSEGNVGVPDPLQPLLASPRQHPSSRASTPCLSLGCL